MNYKDFKTALRSQITEENIPESIGGSFSLYNEPYEFDLSPGSALYYGPRDGFPKIPAEIPAFDICDDSEDVEASDALPLEEVNIRLSFSRLED